MPAIDSHPPGTFCWIELATTDQPAAKAFYTAVFGWSAQDGPIGEGEFYTMFQLNGQNAGAAYTQRADERAMNIPPHWNLYIAVENADETARRAAELGARLLVPPFDVATYGRMSVIQDPNGAVFSIWQAKDHKGIEVPDWMDGAFCWADLNTPGAPAAQKFYSELFGWTFVSDPASGYTHIENGGKPIGGIPSDSQRDSNAPPHWMIYLKTSDCDATTAKAKDLGAQIYFGPVTLEGTGRFTVMADPQGAVSALFQSFRKA